MVNKIKKLFIAGSLISSLFMAVTACNFNNGNTHSSSSMQSSSEQVLSSSSNAVSSSQEQSSSSLAPSSSAISSSNEASSSSNQASSSTTSSSSAAPVVVLNSITATSNKNNYEYGEELDIVVVAHYSDGSSENIKNYDVQGFNNKTPGEQTVVVTYQGKTSSFKVNVNNPVLVDIVAASTKENYEYGEELELVVTANYSDGSSVVVTNYQVQGYNKEEPGEQDVLVTYEGKTSSLSVRVNDPILVSVTANGQKDSYEYGEELNISVSATYSDGSSVSVNEYEVTGFDSTTPGEQTVTVTYEGKTYSFKVTINNPVLVSVTANGQKDSYEYGEELNITVTANYSDDSEKEVTDYTVEGFDSTTPGEQTVTVTYEGKTYSFKVTINNPVLTSITAVSNKDSYESGEELDITVMANYSDGSSVEVTNYTVEGYDKDQTGVQSITVTYEGKSCSLDISIKGKVTAFPVDKLNSFLQVEGIATSIPTPTSYNNWFDSVETEQDGSSYFYATTKDDGNKDVDTIADQYSVLLTTNGWTVDKIDNEYRATKPNGDAEITFATINKTFSIHINAYIEFPTHKTTGLAVASIEDLNDGDEVILGNVSSEYMVTGFNNGSFTTSSCTFDGFSPEFVSKKAWRFTLNKVGNYWQLSDVKGRKLGATGLNQLTWDEGSTEWNLLIANRLAIFTNINSEFGRLCFNSADKRITSYARITNGLSYPQLFKLNTTEIIYPTSISLSGKTDIGKGRSTTLSVECTPNNANSLSDIIWSSSDESIATVNQSGLVTGVAEGQATITAKTKSMGNYLEASIVVEVSNQVLDSWTIMIYMCGSDLESGYYHFATSDIREILSVNGQPDDVNIIIETGGSRSWSYSGIDAKYLSRYHVRNRSLVLDEKITKASMGKQSTFESFLDWGLTQYPADKTGVILWNHGGALGGCCYDENFNSDSLLNSEANAAFANVFSQHNIDKLEFVGYDACLMQIQDVAEFNSQYFNYMVGSEEAEDGYGWDYDNWLDDVFADKDTETILKATCDSFVVSCGTNSDQCLSYLKLNKMANYFEKFEAMAAAIKNTAKNNYSGFKSIINSAKRYEAFSSYGVMDGLSFLKKLGNNSTYSSFQSEIEEAKTAYTQLVGYSRKGSSAGDTNGLGVIGATSCSYPSSETHFTNWRSIFK